jgi:16S rRNA (adenine1518-N6/adenine1519-N6)-dimethyltransferase
MPPALQAMLMTHEWSGHARPRKSLGQHFLHQEAVIERILRHFAPTPEDVVVEIGPGRGALTWPLLKRVQHLHVIELDDALAAYWRSAAREYENLTVHHADALEFHYRDIAGAGRLRVIGNLPYNISSPLIFHLLDQSHCISNLCLMLQKEVVDRLCAAPGTKDYGRLSVMVQQRCSVHRLFTVSRGAFTPPPKVESAMVELVPWDRPPVAVKDPALFAEMVKRAFGQRRKTLRNALADLMEEAGFTACGIDPGLRAERLSVADFARLSEQAKRPVR